MTHPAIYFYLFLFVFVIYRTVSLYTFGFSLPFYGVVFPKNTQFYCVVFFSICMVLGVCYSVFFFIVSVTASALVDNFILVSPIENALANSDLEPAPPEDPSFVLPSPQEKNTFLERCKTTFTSYIDRQVVKETENWKPEAKELVAAILPTTESEQYDSYQGAKAFAEANGSKVKEETAVVGLIELENGKKGIVVNPSGVFELKQIAGDSGSKGLISKTRDTTARTVLKWFYNEDVCVARKEGDIAAPSLVEGPSLKPILTKAPTSAGILPGEIKIPKSPSSPNSPDHRIEDAF